MADWHLPLEDVLAFMDDDERARWDAASQEERDEMRRILSDLWYAIPDPTEAELERLMAPMDWAHCQRGENREGIRAFYIRKWKKDRKAEACKRLAETKPQSDSNNSPKPSSGIRVPAQWADRTEQERILQAAEKAHQKAFEAFLSSTADGTEDQINELFKDFPQLRAEYDRAAQPKRKQAIIETAKHLRREADKREEDRLEAEQQRITKAFDYWHQCQEKGIAAEKLPSKDAPIEEVLKWYDDTRKPVRSIPFPGEGGYSSNKTGGDTPPHPSTFNIFDVANALRNSDVVKFVTPRPEQRTTQKADVSNRDRDKKKLVEQFKPSKVDTRNHAFREVAAYCWDATHLYYIAGGFLAVGAVALAVSWLLAEILFAIGIALFIAKGIHALWDRQNRIAITSIFLVMGILAITSEVVLIELAKTRSHLSTETTPPIENITFAREAIPGEKDLPFGLRLTIQSNVSVSPVHFVATCSAPIGDARSAPVGNSGVIEMSEKRAGVSYEFRWEFPPLTPQKPISVWLYSSERITCDLKKIDE